MQSFRGLSVIILFAFISLAFSVATFAQQPETQKASPDPAEATKKLGAFLGRWNTAATFASGDKATTELECRWSSQSNYLVCEQHVKLSNGREQRQLAVYSYNSGDGTYQYATFADPGQKPSSGTVEIKGNVWTYNSSFESHGGKKTLIRNTNEFTDGGKTEVFKVVTSDDDGKTWKPLLDGSAHKIAD